FNDIHPHFNDDPLSGSTTYSTNSLLEEFSDELALISYPPDYDDNRACDIESDIRVIKFLLFQCEDSDFKDSIDQSVLTHCDDLFDDPTPEMFTDKQPPNYSFPPRFDVYPDDFLEIESDATFDGDSFDSEGEKIKEAKLLIDPLDLPCDILSEYDSFNSQDFSRDDVLFSPNNEDKVFNPGILSHKKSVKIITREKKLAVSFASWLFKDFDPLLYELLVFKEVPNSMRLLSFSSENEEKVFKPEIYTFEKFHCCFLSELSHPGTISIKFQKFQSRWTFNAPPSPNYVPGTKHPPSLDYVPGPEYPEYLVPSDDEPTDQENEEDEEEEHLALSNSSTAPIHDHVPSAEETKPFETVKSGPTPPSPRLRKAMISIRPQTPMAVATKVLVAAVAIALPSSSLLNEY
nr:hypothetical protein [Tanacetum cinerariifolium]